MAIFRVAEIFLITLSIIFFCLLRYRKRKTCHSPTNWPVVGMLPGILWNCHRIHDYATEILSEVGGTFEWKGPWFCNMNMVITCDPANIHHIFSKNFCNYPKGPEFRKIFEILGDGIFNADFQLWELHRRTTLSAMSNSKFYGLLERTVWEKIRTGLLPVLDSYCESEADLDLQDVFQRLTFDSICKLILDYDPRSLSHDMPYVACEKALNDAIEALLHRHVVPEVVWKVQKWLGIGKEKKLKEAWKAFDEFIFPCIEEINEQSFLGSFRSESDGDSRKFLRDTALNLMLAGRDTTSTCLTWLFWLIATNAPTAVKIRQEIEDQLQGNNWREFTVEDSRKLVYLHGALCESLRLYPPVALEHKAPTRPDSLPSGNYLEENTRVVISFYSVGRMESVWGEEWSEFKPERWMTARGGIRHEPSYNFPAFNAGPRTCLGKEMAFIQMKMVAATIIQSYDIQIVEAHPVAPAETIILQIKSGLRVKLSKRN